MTAALIDGASWLLLGAGGAILLIGSLGLVRLPDFWSRLHAAGMIDTLGAGLLLAGMLLQAGWSLTALKILIVGLLIFITSPTAAHAIANAAWIAGIKPLRLARDESAPFDDRRHG